MFKLQKFYPAGFNPQQYWENKYAQEHIAGKNSTEFKKQGFWPLLQQHLQPGKRYLDAGCGIGGWIIFLREQGYTVEGIDIAARTIRALTEYDPDLKVKVAGITHIPYTDQSLDGVLAIGTLEYVENNVPGALKEVHRVLKPGGLLFIEVPLINALRRFIYFPLKQLEKLLKVSQGKQPTFANYLFNRQSIQRLVHDAGFEIIAIQPHELPDPTSHYGLYIDFLILRGRQPYQLNKLGLLVKWVCNSLSPWIASTGMVVVARKRS